LEKFIKRRSKKIPVFLALIGFARISSGADLETIVNGLQRRYVTVTTVTAAFKQIYRAPGIEQTESGVFWLKKPGLMRWEYKTPEEKLFVADGRESFLYVPRDRQVTVQPLAAADLHRTPLEFLLGAGNINRSFVAAWETVVLPQSEGTYLVRLTPRNSEAEYAFLTLELDQTCDLRRIVIREHGGTTSEFQFTNLQTNIKVNAALFQFKPPKNVEVIRLENE
jgi:outer membrane lipoprotein carrier protein